LKVTFLLRVRKRVARSLCISRVSCQFVAVRNVSWRRFALYTCNKCRLRPDRDASMSVSVGLSVCLSVCPHAHISNHTSKLYQALRTSYLRPWLGPSPAGCNTLCTSGFVDDDAMFSYNGPCGDVEALPQQPRCNVVHELTPLLHGIGCVLWRQG